MILHLVARCFGFLVRRGWTGIGPFDNFKDSTTEQPVRACWFLLQGARMITRLSSHVGSCHRSNSYRAACAMCCYRDDLLPPVDTRAVLIDHIAGRTRSGTIFLPEHVVLDQISLLLDGWWRCFLNTRRHCLCGHYAQPVQKPQAGTGGDTKDNSPALTSGITLRFCQRRRSGVSSG